jgi:hypothetical protein
MRYITCLAHSVAAGTGFLLAKTLESAYARCQSQTLRAIDPDAGAWSPPRLGRA